MGKIREEAVASKGCGNDTEAKSRMDEKAKQSKEKEGKEQAGCSADGGFLGGEEKVCVMHEIPAEKSHGWMSPLGSLSSHEQRPPCTMETPLLDTKRTKH